MSGDDFSAGHEQQDPVTDPQLGWTPAELEPLSSVSLRLVDAPLDLCVKHIC